MNVHVPPHVVRAATRFAEGKAFLSLAKKQRVISGQYRIWAREAEAEGNLDSYRRYKDEARRTFRAAKWHLAEARSRLNGN